MRKLYGNFYAQENFENFVPKPGSFGKCNHKSLDSSVIYTNRSPEIVRNGNAFLKSAMNHNEIYNLVAGVRPIL